MYKDWTVIRTQSKGIELIAKERTRQVEIEGFTEEHDKNHKGKQLATAAACYTARYVESGKNNWPWDAKWWKPSDIPVRNLVKAGALIAAEIDRLQTIEGE